MVTLEVVDVDVSSDVAIQAWFDVYSAGLAADRTDVMVVSLAATTVALRHPEDAVSALLKRTWRPVGRLTRSRR